MNRWPFAVLTAAALVPLSTPAAAADDLVTFISPSGNVGCVLDAHYARCDIVDRDWNPPPRPADCEFDYGQGVGLAPGEPAAFVCAGDTTLGGEQVLGYGDALTRGRLTCESSESGVACRDTGTGRGFSLSREIYQLF